MTSSKDEATRMIEELRGVDRLSEQLKPMTFDIAKDLLRQHREFDQIAREATKELSSVNFREHLDAAASAKDFLRQHREFDQIARDAAKDLSSVNLREHLEAANSAAAEIRKLVGNDQIAQLMKEVASLDVVKQLAHTTSHLLQTRNQVEQLATKYAELYPGALAQLLAAHQVNQNLFASNLFTRVQSIEPSLILTIENPTAAEIEEIDPHNVGLNDEQKNALISIESLPTRLLATILRSPNELRQLTPRQFEEFVAAAVEQLGFRNVVLTPRSRDGGKDVIASIVVAGIPTSFYFECKHYAESNKVQLDTLRALLGTVASDSKIVNKGILVTTSTFTSGARKFILGDARLDGKDYDDILGWIEQIKKKRS
jgi:hypothetical protein